MSTVPSEAQIDTVLLLPCNRRINRILLSGGWSLRLGEEEKE